MTKEKEEMIVEEKIDKLVNILMEEKPQLSDVLIT